jgi:hypothetical protein
MKSTTGSRIFPLDSNREERRGNATEKRGDERQ